jgi:hypothetical protein
MLSKQLDSKKSQKSGLYSIGKRTEILVQKAQYMIGFWSKHIQTSRLKNSNILLGASS